MERPRRFPNTGMGLDRFQVNELGAQIIGDHLQQLMFLDDPEVVKAVCEWHTGALLLLVNLLELFLGGYSSVNQHVGKCI